MRTIFYGLAIVFGILSSFSLIFPSESSANADQCSPPSYKEIVDRADVIFTGKVISKELSSHQISFGDPRYNIQFEIDEILLGESKDFLNITTSEGFDLSNRMYSFNVGEKYFVSAYNSTSSDYATEIFGNNVLIAIQSYCSSTLVIPLSSGLDMLPSSKNCDGSVHMQCHESCRLDEYRHDGEGLKKQYNCFQSCYEENTDQCMVKSYTLEEALEIQRNRTSTSITNNSSSGENIPTRELTAEEKDFESCKVGLTHHVNYGLGSWSISIQRNIDNYCYMEIFHDLEGGGSDIFCSIPIGKYKAKDWNSKPWFPLTQEEDKSTVENYCHTIKSSNAFFPEYTVHFSPGQQIKFGMLPDQIICKQDLVLIFKSNDNSPVCVKPQTGEKLIHRGWANP